MKEMKLLLDMYKGVGKEQRDKVQLMAAERKTRAELEDLRQQVKKIQVCCNTFYNYYTYTHTDTQLLCDDFVVIYNMII